MRRKRRRSVERRLDTRTRRSHAQPRGDLGRLRQRRRSRPLPGEQRGQPPFPQRRRRRRPVALHGRRPRWHGHRQQPGLELRPLGRLRQRRRPGHVPGEHPGREPPLPQRSPDARLAAGPGQGVRGRHQHPRAGLDAVHPHLRLGRLRQRRRPRPLHDRPRRQHPAAQRRRRSLRGGLLALHRRDGLRRRGQRRGQPGPGLGRLRRRRRPGHLHRQLQRPERPAAQRPRHARLPRGSAPRLHERHHQRRTRSLRLRPRRRLGRHGQRRGPRPLRDQLRRGQPDLPQRRRDLHGHHGEHDRRRRRQRPRLQLGRLRQRRRPGHPRRQLRRRDRHRGQPPLPQRRGGRRRARRLALRRRGGHPAGQRHGRGRHGLLGRLRPGRRPRRVPGQLEQRLRQRPGAQRPPRHQQLPAREALRQGFPPLSHWRTCDRGGWRREPDPGAQRRRRFP